MKKYFVTMDCDYVVGYLRNGHLEGEIEADSEEEAIEKAKENSWSLDLVVDDYRVDDYEADFDSTTAQEVKE